MEIQSKRVAVLIVAVPATLIILLLGIPTLLTLSAHGATVTFSQSNFHNPLNIDNKYFPLVPGTTFLYKGTKDGEPSSDAFQVTNLVKVIQGISARVIHDNAYVKGKLSETTDDWFAQDDKGNVCYMGEFTTDLTNKENHHEGFWEAGVKGSKAGIIMEAQPKVGHTYQQEFA